MARVIRAQRVSFSQRLVVYLVCVNFLLVAAYATLSEGLDPLAGVLVPGLLVFYNVLLSWLVIRRSKRRSDRFMLYTMTISVLLLSVSLFTRLYV